MRYISKTKSIRIVLRLIVGLTMILFVLDLSNAQNQEAFTSHKGQFRKAEPVSCGDELEDGHFELTGDLTCSEDPAIRIIGPAKLNLKGYTLSGHKGKNDCILIEGDGAWVWNGIVKNCKDGIEIKLESDRNRITGVKSYNNERRGFRIRGNKNLLFNCSATYNDRKGFSIEKGDGNLVFNCLGTNNGQQGFSIEEGDGNKIYYSNSIANCRDGIEIDGGSHNRVINNFVEDNGNREICDEFGEDYNPWYYAGIDVTYNSEYSSENNEIKYNRACGNLGCVPCYDENLFPTCNARERDFWDENVDENGDCDSTNVWKNNRVVCKNVAPECSPKPEQ